MDVHPTKNVSIGIDPYPYYEILFCAKGHFRRCKLFQLQLVRDLMWEVHPASQVFTVPIRSHPFPSIPIPTAGLGSFSPSCKLRAGFKITFGTGAVLRVDTFGQP